MPCQPNTSVRGSIANNMKLFCENKTQIDPLQLKSSLGHVSEGVWKWVLHFPRETILKMMVRFPGSHSKAHLHHNVTEITQTCKEKRQEKYCCSTSN